MDAPTVRAIETLQRMQGHGHIWLVGAYSRYSMPLLENGVKSAMAVSRALGVDTSDVEFDEEKGAAKAASQALLQSFLMLLLAIALTAVHYVLYE